jgi:hypothetical protein
VIISTELIFPVTLISKWRVGGHSRVVINVSINIESVVKIFVGSFVDYSFVLQLVTPTTVQDS